MTNTNKKYITNYTSNIFESTISKINAGNNGCNIIIPHVCNNINLFGAGFAAAIGNYFPVVKENFHNLGNKARLGYVQYVSVNKNKSFGHELVIANMIAQNKTIGHNNPRPLNYEFLAKCMIDVRDYANHLQHQTESMVEIHCPKFGSGLAGGNWYFIEELIKDIWANIPIYVYSISKQKNVSKY